MGIKQPKYFTYNIKGLTIRAVKDLIKSVRQITDRSILKIDVDCNWLAFKLGANKKPNEAATKVADFLQCLASKGFIVTPICDGQIRHHSKRASTEREADNEKNKINASLARLELLAITHQLRSDIDIDDEERSRLQNKQRDLNRLVTKLETKASNGFLYPTFAADLDTELELRDAFSESDNHHGKIVKLKVGLYQADALIAKRAIDGDSHMILGADSDFFVSVGRKCILIKDFKFKKPIGRQSKQISLMEISNIQLGCSNQEMKEEIENALDETTRNKVVFEDAKYPLFDEEVIYLRALIAIIIGNDVFVGGVNKVGVTKVYNKIMELRTRHGSDGDSEIIDDLKIWVCQLKETNITMDLLNVFIDTMVFEPVNEVTTNGEIVFEDDNDKKYTYLYHRRPPPTLPKYLEDFSYHQNNFHTQCTRIVEGPEICHCVGPVRGRRHIVMKEENGGVSQCHGCNQYVCLTCRIKSDDTGNILCLPCYSSEKLTPFDESDIPNETNRETTIGEMRKKMDELGLELDADALPMEVEDIYDAYVQKEQLKSITEGLDEIPFPVLESNVINEIFRESNTRRNDNLPDGFDCVIGDVFFSEGGQFIANENITNDMLPSLFGLFATLIEYKKDVRYTKFEHKVYSALPSYYIELANGSRMDSGFRLLRRCARHAMDSNARDLINTDGKLFKTSDGLVGIAIKNVVPASMKNTEYDTYAAFTARDLLACKCSCPCGGEGTEKIVCVHVLPLIFQLSLLLIEGLAENILLEFCA